jgi:hypothetical protein
MTTKAINKVYQQLVTVVNSTYSKSAPKSIIKLDSGILVFGVYLIVKINNGYKIYTKYTFTEVEFSDIRNAFTWIIFDHTKKFKICQRIIELDSKISSLGVEIAIHKKASEKTDIGRYVIMLNKIQDEQMRKQDFVIELENYIESAKKIAPSILELY